MALFGEGNRYARFRTLSTHWYLAAVSLRAVSTPSSQAPARDATAILAQAREALGGEKRLSAVKSFVATGRTRQVRGDNLVPIEFEIAVELPDKYVRKDEIPAQESGPTSTGFNGSDLIQLPVPVAPAPPAGPAREGGPPAPNPAQLEAMRAARVATVKQDFVRLTLGMFASSFSSYPLTFTYVGQAEAPQGKADVIEVKAAPNFTARLFVNSETHLPVMVSWQAPAGRGGPGRGGPGGPGAPGAGPAPEGRGGPARPGAGPPAAPGAAPAQGAAQPPAARPGDAGATPAPLRRPVRRRRVRRRRVRRRQGGSNRRVARRRLARTRRSSTRAGGVSDLLRRLSRRRWDAVAVPPPASDRSRYDRGDHVRSVPGQHED